MNAWCGIILFGEAIGDRALRDLGIYLFTTEMNAIQEYWFDVHGDNFPTNYPASVVTMVWGGKGANGTWFSADPQLVHGINFLPMHGGSLYLGLYPAYVEKNYAALVTERSGWPRVFRLPIQCARLARVLPSSIFAVAPPASNKRAASPASFKARYIHSTSGQLLNWSLPNSFTSAP